MKKSLYLLLLFVFVWGSCKKDEVTTGTEEEQIEAYISQKKLTVTEKTASGLRYIRTTAGAGIKPKVGQTVTLNYAGRLLNDKQFDAGAFSFALGSGQVIAGFDEGIAKMSVGEKATLIFPSSIGYGARGQGQIPGNAPLIFDIEITGVK